jgi:site-specific DNA-methyltransferase (adenine-specific)
VSATFKLHLGDCIATMRTLAEASVDAIVTDPPYELGFMGKSWDASGIANNVEMWAEALRVLKPGGHLLAFSGSRTYHRMVCAIEDAGFEIRDQIMWVYGSGFPKSLDVSKAIDKAAGAEREKILVPTKQGNTRGDFGVTFSTETHAGFTDISEPVTDAARQWQGWGTALKPAHEPIVVARKPLIGTVAANVLAHGTGALNIDGCRVQTETPRPAREGHRVLTNNTYAAGLGGSRAVADTTEGRWPANLIHDGSDEVLAAFPQAPGQQGLAKTDGSASGNAVYSALRNITRQPVPRADAGSAARFFYAAKASKSDRNEGLDDFAPITTNDGRAVAADNAYQRGKTERTNHHPTVKPTDLMAYLVRLVTPPGGTVLDPFTGSGSTGKACMCEGFNFVGCELSPEYLAIAKARIEHEQLQAAIRAYDVMLKAA